MGVLAGPQLNVITEPLGLLMCIGVAAHVGQQRGVVDERALILVEAEAVSQTQRDPALAQHVLHRLAEAEIDTKRQRADELRQANPFQTARLVHTDASLDRSSPLRRAHMTLDQVKTTSAHDYVDI